MRSGDLSYEQTRAFTARLNDQAIQVISKPGAPHWDCVSPASLLLAHAVRPAPDARCLLLGCGHGALGVALARQAREVVLADTSMIAVEMARRTLDANMIANARVSDAASVLPDQASSFDLVAVELPRDRGLARRWLVEAHGALRMGGDLFLAGANDNGVRALIGDAAALFGDAAVLAYKGGSRTAHARKVSDDVSRAVWASEPGIGPGAWHEFAATVRGHSFQLRCLPGVFACGRLDEGSALLLAALDIPARAGALDLGCGCGVIGLAAGRLGAAQVDLADANLLAVAAARENIALNQVAGARALASDGVPTGEPGRYDVVATNPPFHVGKTVDYEVARAFIAQTRRALRPGGKFWLVGNQFIRYDQLLRGAFEKVECAAENRSYRVWKAT